MALSRPFAHGGKYDSLKTATPEQLLKATIKFYIQSNPEAEKWLRLGFALAQDDGWENVAPAWLREVAGE